MSPVLIPIRDQLLHIRNELVNIAFQEIFNEQDILAIQERLVKIDRMRGRNGIFFKTESSEDNGAELLALWGQGTLTDILETNFKACHGLLCADFSPIVESIRKRLIDIKNELQNMELISKWSLWHTDLFPYQLQLHDVARMLHEPDQIDDETGRILLSYLLTTCYNIMLSLLGEGPSVAESLLPIYNQLNTLRDCLKRLKSLNCKLKESEKMLYILKLRSIDMKFENGAFHDEDGYIPEGQSKCMYALEECYRLIQELSDDSSDNEDEEERKSEGEEEEASEEMDEEYTYTEGESYTEEGRCNELKEE